MGDGLIFLTEGVSGKGYGPLKMSENNRLKFPKKQQKRIMSPFHFIGHLPNILLLPTNYPN